MQHRPFRSSVLAFCIILAAGCAPAQPQLDTAATQTAAALSASATPRPTATLVPTRTPRPTATASPTPARLTAAEIFETISPSVVFVDTPAGTGSGVLIAGGYIVTNAHVVWPYTRVRIAFADGTEHTDVPVHNLDLLGDLAILGPLEAAGEPLPFVNGESLAVGSAVYLIGYPGEVEKFPRPTIASGVISRLREAEALGLTYFQTDAQVAGGQSGGVLVSEMGDVIGISGVAFTEVSFGLVASAADLLPRIDQLIAGDDITRLGDRGLGLDGGLLEHSFGLAGYWDARVYVIREPAGTELEVTVESENDAVLQVLDVYGNQVLSLDESATGFEGGSVRLDLETPYFVLVTQLMEGPGEFRIRSNRPLIAYSDTDDGRRLKLDNPLWGSLDFPGDVDYFVIDLEAGEAIYLQAASSMIDPYLAVDYEGAGDDQIISDDDSGGGVFGLDAELTYLAPHAGRYQVVVVGATGMAIGGYGLSLQRPGASAPTASVPLLTPTPIDSPLGPMALYTSQRYPFAIEYPAGWVNAGAQPELGVVANYSTEDALLSLTEEDLAAIGLSGTTVSEYAELVISTLRAYTADFSLISRSPATTPDGLDVIVLEYTFLGGTYRAARLIYVHDDRVGFGATYVVTAQDYQQLKPIFDYSFTTFHNSAER
jgi:S1-C subfamily serine protease